MNKLSHAARTVKPVSLHPSHADDLYAAIQETLGILADIETRYESELFALDAMHLPDREREQAEGDLERRRMDCREPYSRRLAELYRCLTFNSVVRMLH